MKTRQIRIKNAALATHHIRLYPDVPDHSANRPFPQIGLRTRVRAPIKKNTDATHHPHGILRALRVAHRRILVVQVAVAVRDALHARLVQVAQLLRRDLTVLAAVLPKKKRNRLAPGRWRQLEIGSIWIKRSAILRCKRQYSAGTRAI